ncbi:alpha-tocopherol transfer protein-like [Folsomia candida]|uniref:alpha-tocopherol transfer protein-like n=1 Tax=Folsomia candida TaxID=158441 RepID=UPI000B8EFC7A|nr:alpha-tocopherol transfer protein-like [Folsomia candida]
MGSDNKLSLADNSISRPENSDEQEALDQIRSLIKKLDGLECPTEDVYLLRFLRYRKNDIARTVESIASWWKNRHRFDFMHTDMHPSHYVQTYGFNFATVLAHRDALGRQVVLVKLENWDPAKMSLLEASKADFCSMDTVTSRQLTQLHGVVFVLDLAGLALSHVQSCTPFNLKTVINLSDGYPMKIKGIHFVNHPYIFNTVHSVAKMFMKKKMKKRIQLHGYDYTSLHKFVDPAILPKTYGGLLDDVDAEEKDFKGTLLDKDQYYRDLFDVKKYGYQTKKN